MSSNFKFVTRQGLNLKKIKSCCVLCFIFFSCIVLCFILPEDSINSIGGGLHSTEQLRNGVMILRYNTRSDWIKVMF